MTTVAARSAGEAATSAAVESADWRAAAIAMLSVRVIQGFIYWGGGSRRFIYDPSKLDPDAPSWMANKLQTAIPGALFGLDRALAFLLDHFWLLYAAIVLFSAVELIVGFALMAGLPDAARGAHVGRTIRFADAAVRMAGRNLRRRMDDGRLQCRDGRNAHARRQRRLFAR